MRIKKYVARTMREALAEIRNELGESAVILKTGKTNRTGFPFGGTAVEVTAAIDDEHAVRPAFPELQLAKPGIYLRPRASCIVDEASRATIRPWRPPVLPAAARKTDAPAERGELHYTELKEDLRRLTDMVKSVVKTGGTSTEGGFMGGYAVLYKKLIDSEVKPETAAELVGGLQASAVASANGSAEAKMLDLLRGHFPVAGPIKCKKRGPMVVAFVGPTGAGKTTTLAKLAAHCRMSKNKRVSLITADTYRIAAIDQIRAFADIVKVNLQVVFSRAEVTGALAACVNDDLVFVDTAGRNQRSGAHAEELKAMLGAIKPDEVHCVVSATTKDSDLLDTIARYRELGANRLIFTKLDETVHLGNIYNTVTACDVPVSFFGFGQSVPDDIELAQPARFVQRLWEGSIA